MSYPDQDTGTTSDYTQEEVDEESAQTIRTVGTRIVPWTEIEQQNKLFEQLNKERDKTVQITELRKQQLMADPAYRSDSNIKDTLREWNDLDYRWRLLSIQEGIGKTLSNLKEQQDDIIPSGRIYAARIPLPVNGIVVSLDLEYGQHLNLPINNTVVIHNPDSKVTKVSLFNEGPGMVFWHAFGNNAFNAQSAMIPLPPTYGGPYTYNPRSSISWVNVRNSDGLGATVDIITEV